jgi:hypothetical protein
VPWDDDPKTLLVCGILSSLLYVAMNVFIAMQWEGYSSVNPDSWPLMTPR